jgi:hypothetical protein
MARSVIQNTEERLRAQQQGKADKRDTIRQVAFVAVSDIEADPNNPPARS